MSNQTNYKDMDLLSNQLHGMLLKHIDWLLSLNKVIICKTSPSSLKKMHHEECDFGRWYYSVEISYLKGSTEFEKLGATHISLHSIANQILESYKNSKTPSEEEYQELIDSEKAFIETLNNFIDNVLTAKNQFDYLTNIPNRGLAMLLLEKEYSKLCRGMISECSIAYADIDYFKSINDNYGHSAGDSLLEHISKIFLSNIRTYDTVGRYGGEEFIFCFPQTSAKEATEIVNKLRSKIESSVITTDSPKKIKATCSFGVANMEREKPLSHSINCADKALYEAKNNGRNRTETWENKEQEKEPAKRAGTGTLEK